MKYTVTEYEGDFPLENQINWDKVYDDYPTAEACGCFTYLLNKNTRDIKTYYVVVVEERGEGLKCVYTVNGLLRGKEMFAFLEEWDKI